jgi:LPXTG-motif cell wall-anchored protein
VTFGEQGWPVSGTVRVDGTNAPIAGVTIALTGTDVFGSPVSMALTTGTDGSYGFTNVPPGSYTLTQTQPAGFDNGLVNPTNTITFVLGAGASAPQNFTETGSTLSGLAYVDINKNGVFDARDTPNPGVTITITGTDNAGNDVNVTVVTDADGHWSVPGLRAGDYEITETQPAHLRDGAATLGTGGGTILNANTMTMTLSPGIDATGYAFGDVSQKLPTTGATVLHILQLAGALLALGTAMRLIRRRSRRV